MATRTVYQEPLADNCPKGGHHKWVWLGVDGNAIGYYECSQCLLESEAIEESTTEAMDSQDGKQPTR